MKKILIILTFIFATIFNVAHAQENQFIGKYSFDLLKTSSFKEIIYSESRVIDNLKDFEESTNLMKDGVSIPSVEINGYTYVQACRPHECNLSYTIWAFNNDTVYASVIDENSIRIYGNPPIDVKFNLTNEH